MQEFEAYNVKTKLKTKVLEAEIVTMKNGRKAVRGIAADDGATKVYKILSKAEEESL